MRALANTRFSLKYSSQQFNELEIPLCGSIWPTDIAFTVSQCVNGSGCKFVVNHREITKPLVDRTTQLRSPVFSIKKTCLAIITKSI